MQLVRIWNLVTIGLGLLVGLGQPGTARGGANMSPTCDGASYCTLDSLVCRFPDTTVFVGSMVISDFADGLSSDGHGAYIEGVGDVVSSRVTAAAMLTIYHSKTSVQRPRAYSVNLDHPVLGGAGRALGTITDTTGNGIGFMTQWSLVGDAFKNLQRIPVGRTVPAAMTSIVFPVDGRGHLLQMGPLPNGHCHNGGRTLVSGTGTTAATIYHATPTRWIVDLPAGSVARLFDISNGTDHAVDKGLYHFRLHYEIGN